MRQKVVAFFLKTINLSDGTDVKGTIDSIRNNITVQGYNVWILACGALLASIGLDTNSPAVIIGAMLISPLMSPILGIGLSVGINDRDTLIKSLENFSVAVAASLIMSTLYFLVTPLGDATPEILARVKPTLLDVGVAIFGGVAGIVAGSRKDKTNAIPGVAIATALMPPLCVAGYGIAHFFLHGLGEGGLEIFSGAFYLFFINSVFIALSTYAIVRFLNFPYTEYVDINSRKKVVRYIAILSILVIIPSAYFMINIIRDFRRNKEIERFIETQVKTDKQEVFRYSYEPSDSTLKLYITGEDYIGEEEEQRLNTVLDSSSLLSEAKLKLVQFNVSPEDRENLRTEVGGALQELELRVASFGKKQLRIDSLSMQLSQIKADTLPFSQIKQELKVLYPDLQHLSFSMALETDFDKYQDTIPLFLVKWGNRIGPRTRRSNQVKMTDWLMQRLQMDTVKVVGM